VSNDQDIDQGMKRATGVSIFHDLTCDQGGRSEAAPSQMVGVCVYVCVYVKRIEDGSIRDKGEKGSS
jgi:hypothetical protein